MDTEMGNALRHVKNKVFCDKNKQQKNTWQKEKCTRSKTLSALHKKKKMLHLVPQL